MLKFFDGFWHKTLRRPYVLTPRIDEGKGQAVIFLHGIAAKSESWRLVVNELDNNVYRSVALDVLGFGQSPKPGWIQYSIDDHARSVIATIGRRRFKKPVVLVGHSMGSLIATRVAAMRPDLVEHLILYQMPLYGDFIEDRSSKLRQNLYMSVYKKMTNSKQQMLRLTRPSNRFLSKVIGIELDHETWVPFQMSLRNTIMQQQVYNDLRASEVRTDVVFGRFDLFVIRDDIMKFLKKEKHISFHTINESHRISKKGAKIIARLIRGGTTKS